MTDKLSSMKKEQIESELKSMFNQLVDIEEKAILEFKTVVFLGEQVQQLISKMEDPNVAFEEKEQVKRQLEALEIKIQSEIKICKNQPDTSAIHERLNYLKSQPIED